MTTQEVPTYAVYVCTDSTSAPIAVADTWTKAVTMARALNAVLADDTDLFYADDVLSQGHIPAHGYYRDADNMTMVREVATPAEMVN